MLSHTWLPTNTPDNNDTIFKVIKAYGPYIILENHHKIYDAISSWWCKPLGHCNPLVIQSINTQLKQFEHHIPTNLYNDTIEKLSAKLTQLNTNLEKVAYASDGSSAIEIAMKLSYEFRLINGQTHRTKFIALNNAYHGETIFTLSVCGLNHYKSTYQPYLVDNFFLNDIPYVSSRHDQLWNGMDNNYNEIFYNKLEQYITQIAPNVTALIIEPIVQGAAGIKIISLYYLQRLIQITQKYNIHIICDEIMVGLGRLGYTCVSKELLNIEPEFICVAKNLTAGSIPMSATIMHKTITDSFNHANKAFTHSHTHSCNALAASVANSYLDYLESSTLKNDVLHVEKTFLQIFSDFTKKYDFIKNPRAFGAIGACDLMLDSQVIKEISNIGITHGIYLRPIGNTFYIMPPLYNLQNDMDEIITKLDKVLSSLS